MKTIRDVFSSVYEWSKNLIGLFFYIKNQLTEYELIMKISQSSIMTLHRLMKTKLFGLLCSIRRKIVDLHGCEKIIDIIETKNKPSVNTNRSYHKSIVKTSNASLSSEQKHIRSSIDFYYNLIEYDKQLSTIINKNFDDRQLVFNTSHLSKQINNYSLHMQRINKYVKDAIDLSESFRRVSFIY
jgi:hypothetical protein